MAGDQCEPYLRSDNRKQYDEAVARREESEDEAFRRIVERARAAGTARPPSPVTVRRVDPATLRPEPRPVRSGPRLPGADRPARRASIG